MNRRQYLLMKLAEECSEVAKEALKQMQFGPHSIPPNNSGSYPEGIPNHERLRGELIDLDVIVKMLKEVGELHPISYEQELKHARAKRAKIEKYWDISAAMGHVAAGVRS